MKRNLIILIGILTLTSCKEQVAKFIFDASKMSNHTKYMYKYESDKLISQTENNFTIVFGQVVDSMISQTNFEYDNKGLLIKEISQTDFEETPTIKIYNYDESDSLISALSINTENDTTFWEIYKYYPDGKRTVFHRLLSRHFDPNQDFMEAMKNKKLDTTLFRNEFEYAGNLCKAQSQFDKHGNLLKTVNFEYNGTQLRQVTYLTYFNNMEMTEKVKFYDYSKSNIKPDFYSLDIKNDTIELCLNEFNKGLLTTSTESYEYGRNINKTFYENEKAIGMIGVDLNLKFKILESYEYYEHGKLKSIKSYNEEINNAR